MLLLDIRNIILCRFLWEKEEAADGLRILL